jgi:hypothetical protein
MTQPATHWLDLNKVPSPFAGSIAVAVGDVMYQDPSSKQALPLTSLSDQGGKTANQTYAVPLVLGVAAEALSALQVRDSILIDRQYIGPVLMTTSAIWHQGQLISPASNGGNTGLKNQTFEATSNAALAVGQVELDSIVATTTPTARVFSQLMPAAIPNAISTSGTNLGLSGTLAVAGVSTFTGTVIAANATTPVLQVAAGSSNTGYVEVLGKTSGGVRLTSADAAGYELIVSAAAVASANRTLTLPDPGGADSVAYLTLPQTLAGKTLTAPVITLGKISVGSPTTATTGIAALPAADVCPIVGVTGQTAYGVKLLTGVAGQQVIVINTTAYACTLKAAAGGTVDGLMADAKIVIAASKRYILVCTAADTWFSIEANAAAAA